LFFRTYVACVICTRCSSWCTEFAHGHLLKMWISYSNKCLARANILKTPFRTVASALASCAGCFPGVAESCSRRKPKLDRRLLVKRLPNDSYNAFVTNSNPPDAPSNCFYSIMRRLHSVSGTTKQLPVGLDQRIGCRVFTDTLHVLSRRSIAESGFIHSS
jgi:hypothetical protein